MGRLRSRSTPPRSGGGTVRSTATGGCGTIVVGSGSDSGSGGNDGDGTDPDEGLPVFGPLSPTNPRLWIGAAVVGGAAYAITRDRQSTY